MRISDWSSDVCSSDLSLAACSSVPLDESASSGSGTGTGGGSSTGQVMDPFNPQSPLAQQRSVYFEFDSYTVPEQYRNVVDMQIGRASCWERVCQYVSISVLAVSLTNKI